MKLNIDKVKNLNNLNERDLHLIAEDIKSIRDVVVLLDGDLKSKVTDSIARLASVERYIEDVDDRLDSNINRAVNLNHKFQGFLATFNGLEVAETDEGLKVSVRGLNERLRVIEEELSLSVFDKIVRFFKNLF